ncbi:TolC family protein [Mucilaginibacter sp.]|jgi:outer membrane protein|uniref:TolC family protein n=1 Tax=Mucilaginibacter sp. TaxID=1882438 RepID=UPI002CF390E9|nr:TolC family protein [Mucilaginibacter sp.]HTI57393.1 TolC family protein [Mucilaginibacter sp.]
MPSKKIFIIIILFAAKAGVLFAQDSTLVGKPLRWSLAQCIEYAKKNNIQINSLRLSKLTAQQEYLLSKASRLPNLTGQASQNFIHQDKQGNVAIVNGNSVVTGGGSGITSSGQYSVNSNVTLFNGGYINNDIIQKNLQVESANLNIIQQENDITLQITQAYLTVLLDKENIISDTSVVNTSTAQVKLEQQRFNVGSVARKDLIQLQAQNSTDKYNLTSAINTERTDLLTLKQLLLLPTNADFDIAKPDTVVFNTSLAPLQAAQDTAFKNRPEIKNGQLGLQIAQYDVKKAKAGYLPTLSAGAGLGSQYTSGNGYFSQLGSNFYQQLGVTLSVPIFTRRQVKTQVEEAKINADQAQLNFDNTKVVLSQNVERAYINVQNAQSQYDAAQEQYKFNQESYRIANEQLKIGASNTVDFLLQKTLFVQAQQAVIQAKYNLLLTQKIYDFYRGIPVTL